MITDAAFKRWKDAVNTLVEEQVLLSTDDLPDIDYYSAFESGQSPEDTANEVIHNAMNS